MPLSLQGDDASASDVLTVAEAASLLRIGRNALYERINRGDVPHRRIGRKIRLSHAGLMRWLDSDRQSAKAGD